VRTPVKLAAFAGGLVLAFAAALGVGAATGSPFDSPETAPHGHRSPDAPGDAAEQSGGDTTDGADAGSDGQMPAGLAVSRDGYTLQLLDPVLPAGDAVDLRLRIVTDNGQPVEKFAVSHEKRMHVILVRRDTSSFQHVHPQMATDGTWSVPVTVEPGSWRVFADFVPAGGAEGPVTLGADLSVSGPFSPEPLPQETRVDTVDGYQVVLEGDLVRGRDTTLAFTVTRDGKPVTDLQPYLGAYGHLVALRAGDLAYLHVHPEDAPPDGPAGGPQIGFSAASPTAGTYRLFLDFQHRGQVRTAEFTLVLEAGEGATDMTQNGASGTADDDPPGSAEEVEDSHSEDDDHH
jgi:hypothetical protein